MRNGYSIMVKEQEKFYFNQNFQTETAGKLKFPLRFSERERKKQADYKKPTCHFCSYSIVNTTVLALLGI